MKLVTFLLIILFAIQPIVFGQQPTKSVTEPKTGSKTVETVFLKHTKAKEMVTVLQTLLGTVKVYSDETRNLLVFYDSAEVIEEAKKIVMANDLPHKQATILIQVAEISRTKSKSLGVELTKYSWDLPTILPPRSNKLTGETTLDLFPGVVALKGEKADVTIKANPKVLVINNQKAMFGSGDRIPIPITQTQVIGGQIAQSTSVQFEDVGVKLQVTPNIFEDDKMLITVSGEISSIGKTTTQGYPQIITRNIETNIEIKNNYTAVLGGLLKEEDRKTRVGIPWLMDIPALGLLFSSLKTETVVTEVQIYITPQILLMESVTPK